MSFRDLSSKNFYSREIRLRRRNVMGGARYAPNGFLVTEAVSRLLFAGGENSPFLIRKLILDGHIAGEDEQETVAASPLRAPKNAPAPPALGTLGSNIGV